MSQARGHFGPAKIEFTWCDYTLFLAMLLFSVLIGIWFGFVKRQNTASEYLLGGRTMTPLPIAMSLVASKISGIALLAIPSDIYYYGSNYSVSCVSVLLSALTSAYVYLPVFHRLRLTSTYEYLHMRFNRKVRQLGSFLFGMHALLHLPLVIYVPALALEQMTDVNVHTITPIICAVCIFYTTVGGLRAVVWTDMLQFSVSIGAIIIVLCVGVFGPAGGGIADVLRKAAEGQRLRIDFNPDPTLRDSFWVMIFGWAMGSLSTLGASQSCVQKFMALPTLRDAKKALAWYVLGAVGVKITCILTGLVLYAHYEGCDPLASGQIAKPDKILPFYVMAVSGSVPGLAGLFIAGVFCASLSTLSASMNCLAGTIYEDFISHYMPPHVSQHTAGNVLKCLVVIIGVISVLMVRVVEHLGNLLPVIISLTGVASGPLLGIFTLGILFPKANSKGAMVGAVTAFASIALLVGTVQYCRAHRLLTYDTKPLSTAHCTLPHISTPSANSTSMDGAETYQVTVSLLRVSFYYYTLIGTGVTLLVGYLVSLLTQNDSPPVHDDLLSPVIRPLLHDDRVDYHSVGKALTMLTVAEAGRTHSVRVACE